MSAPQPRATHLMEYWHVLRKRRWVLLTSVVVLATVVTIGSLLVTPTWRATAIVQIEREMPKVVNFSDVLARDNSFQAYSDFYQTQYRLMSGREVMRRVVRRLDGELRDEVQSGPSLRGRFTAWIGTLLPGEPEEEPAPADPDAPLIAALTARLDIEPIKNTHLVQVAARATQPALAASIANAVAEEYALFNAEIRHRTTGQAGERLDAEVSGVEREVDALNERLREFGAVHSIVDLGNRRSLAVSTLEEVTRASTEARIQKARREAHFEALRTAPPESLEIVRASAAVQEIKGRLTELNRERAEKSRLFKADYPDMVALAAQIRLLEERLAAETESLRRQAVGEAETAWRGAVAEERRLGELEQAQRAAVHDLESSLAEYESLRAAADGKREMRASLLKRRDETGVLSRIDESLTGNVWVVEAAQPPAAPYSPNLRLNLAMALALGLSLGTGLAFFFEYLDSSIKNAEDLERHIGLPALALVPRHGRPAQSRPTASPPGEPVLPAECVVQMAPRSGAAEAYRDLRTTLLLSSPDHPPVVLMVTSSQPSEGKTVTALNIALSLTQIGRRVLLIDADMRRPRIHKVLSLDRARGLSTYLAGNAPWGELIEPSGVPGLAVITSGPIPPNPAELLASNNLTRLLAELRQDPDYDHVVLDTPPVLAVADPVIVSSQVDGVLLVVHAGETPQQTVRAGLEKLRAANARVLGALLNNLEIANQDYYWHRYTYRYGYRYGSYGEGEPAEGPIATATDGAEDSRRETRRRRAL